ncbi:MAG TPA: ferritin [bacterium]|nr:ferritin [bacterium]
MIKPDIEKAINQQIRQELGAAYSYLGMSAYFEHENLAGFASWCLLQHQEELEHAMRLFRYLLDRGGRVTLSSIDAPRADYDSPVEVFKTALQQEEANTRSIDELYQLASTLNDHATISHLQWFVDEQVEEEKSVGEALALVEKASSEVNAMLYLNDKLGARPSTE